MCIVDDAQWLDRVSAQTLAFVARRLLAERVGLVFGVRDGRRRPRAGRAAGARRSRASAPPTRALLLDTTIPGPLDERVRDRILAEASGQPARPAGAAARAAHGDRRRLRAARLDAVDQPDRAGLRAPAGAAAGRHAAAAAARGGRARRRRDAAAARRGAARASPADEAGAGRGRGPDRHRRAGALPASAGALGGVPRGERAGPPRRPPRAGRGDRPAARSRPARVASRARRGALRRGRGGGAGALGRPRAATAAGSPRRPPSWSARPS